MRFSNRTGEFYDEPAVALVNRRAIQCGFSSFTDAWEFATRRIVGFDGRSDVDRIAYRSGVEARYLKWSTPTQSEMQTLHADKGWNPGERVPDLRRIPFLSGDYLQLMGNTFRVDQIDKSRIRWCPECLAEKPYYRSIWSIKAYRCCATHGVQLQSKCQKCQEEQRWPTQGAPRDINRCGCGHHLARQSPSVSRAKPSKLDEWLCASAPDRKSLRRRVIGSEPLLTDGMPYHYALECFSRLGAYAMFPERLYRDAVEEAEAHSLVLTGMECSTRDGFMLLLDKVAAARHHEPVHASHDGNLKSRLDGKYGHLAKWLLSKRQTAPFEAMIDALLEHIGEPQPGVDGRSLRNRFVSATEAAETLSIRLEELWDRLLPLGYVFAARIPPSFKIPVHLLGSLKEPGEAVLGYRAVAQSLSVPEGLAREMLGVGCLAAEVTSANMRRLVVKQRAIERFIQAVEASFLAGREGTPLVPITKIRTALGRAEVIMLLLEGRVSVREIRRGYRGLDRFLVAPDEVERAVHQQIGAVGLKEAIRLLQMNAFEVTALIEHGQIGLLPEAKAQMLRREDIDRCAEAFIGERQALKLLSISRSSFRKMVLSRKSKNDPYYIFKDSIVISRKKLSKIELLVNRKYGQQLSMAV